MVASVVARCTYADLVSSRRRAAADAPRVQGNSPYRGLPDRAVWRQSVGRRAIETVFPVDDRCAPLARGTRVATAGSCFAQRLAENLPGLGLVHFDGEPGPSFVPPDARRQLGYGVYSARYGNVYTAAQLAQLVERAYGRFEPQEPVWTKGERFVDPFRPGIHAGGFVSVEECLEDRRQHLAAVRAVFEEAAVFVFTLGLTEAWRSRQDGAVFPVCPGSGHGGVFDPERHEFVNFSLADVVADLERFLQAVRARRPDLRVILTVSPVPLLATFTDRHVLTATTSAKAKLRVACDEITNRHADVDYFPSYEIVQAGGPEWAFAADRRTVEPRAVAHIMACLAAQFGLETVPERGSLPILPETSIPRPSLVCDEEEILAAMAREQVAL